MTASTRNKIAVIASVILVAALWESIAFHVDNELLFPAIRQIAVRLYQLSMTQKFWISVLCSFGRVLLSFSISFVLGIVLGFATGVSDTLRAFLSLPFAIIRSTPVVAMIMVMLFWFDSSALPVVSGVLMSVPVITDTIGRSVMATDPKLLEMGQVYNFSRWMTFRYIYFNHARPYVFTGAGTIFSLSFKVVAAGEILAVPKFAIGSMMQDSRQIFESSSVLALAFTLVAVSVASSKIFIFVYDGVSRLAVGPVLPQLSNPRSSTAFQTGRATAPAPDAGISIKNLSFCWQDNKFIFKDFSMEAPSGKITTITAPTGRGKTTLLNILAGLIKNYSGTVKCPDAAYVFQESRFLPYTNAIDNVAVPLMTFLDKKQAYERAYDFLSSVNMQDFIASPVDQLSGGQKQLVSIARAFSFNSPVILMDEATANLDQNSKGIVWEAIKNLQQLNHKTMINVTHNPQESAPLSDRVITI